MLPGMVIASRESWTARASILPFLALVAAGCEPALPPLTPPPIPAAALPPADTASSPAASGFGVPQATPSVVEREVALAESLGARLFTHALFTRKAQDALRQARLIAADAPAPDAVVVERGEGGVVHFIAMDGASPRTLYRVAIADGAGDELHLETAPPPTPDDQVAAAFHARKTVLRDWTATLPNEYRSYVISAPGDRPGWLVYLVAQPRKPNEMMVGGHQRFRVTSDGLTIQERFAFSKTDLSLPLGPAEVPAGGVVVGLWMTHLTTDAPTEMHVFLSLLHRLPLQVGTRLGIWEVNVGEITFLGAMGAR